MNIMNLMKHFGGCWAWKKIEAVFFIFSPWKGRFDVHNCSLSSLIQLCAWFWRFLGLWMVNLMNIMKVYEHGYFKRFFGDCPVVVVKFVKFEKWLSSLKFINWRLAGSCWLLAVGGWRSEVAMSDGHWQVSEVEREANVGALRGLRVVVWVLGLAGLVVVCVLLGLVAGR